MDSSGSLEDKDNRQEIKRRIEDLRLDSAHPPRLQALIHALLASGYKLLHLMSMEPPEFLKSTCEECRYKSQRTEGHRVMSEN